MTKTVKEIVAEIKETLDKKGGLKHVYFVACGGSKAAIFPGLYLLQSEAKTFSATTYTSNEFVHATPKELDDRCVAVICSLKATAETVEAVKKANSIGATTIAMTGIKLITQKPLTFRSTTIVGLSIAMGMGVTQASASLAQFPEWVTMIFGKSPVVLATICAVLLNLILPKDKEN